MRRTGFALGAATLLALASCGSGDAGDNSDNDSNGNTGGSGSTNSALLFDSCDEVAPAFGDELDGLEFADGYPDSYFEDDVYFCSWGRRWVDDGSGKKDFKVSIQGSPLQESTWRDSRWEVAGYERVENPGVDDLPGYLLVLDMSSVGREVKIVADNVDIRLTTMGRDASISVNEAAEIMLQLIDR